MLRPFTWDECEVIGGLIWSVRWLPGLVNIGLNIGVTLTKVVPYAYSFTIYDFNQDPPMTYQVNDVTCADQIIYLLRVSLDCQAP